MTGACSPATATLLDWGQRPSAVVADGNASSGRTACHVSVTLAAAARRSSLPASKGRNSARWMDERVAPNQDGGLARVGRRSLDTRASL